MLEFTTQLHNLNQINTKTVETKKSYLFIQVKYTFNCLMSCEIGIDPKVT